GIHHQYPRDSTRLAMPPVPGLLLSGIFFLAFWLISPTYSFAFFPGFMIGYLLYISMHYAQHVIKSPIYGPWKALWKHHHFHHYVNPYLAHGVSTRLWDFVFGTMPKKDNLKFRPKKPG
ncbi:MAG: sterol desaturase family protein, partial [Cyclobacteriaceae bacterium]